MDRQKTIDTVQKLLALAASSPFAEEADAASRKAGHLLASSGLSMTDVERSGASSNVGMQYLQGERGRIPGWEKILMSDVAAAFDCKALALRSSPGKKTLLFVGTPSDLELASHFFAFFRERVRTASAEHLNDRRHMFQGGVKAELNAFRIGMAIVIGERLRAMFEARNQAIPAGSRDLILSKGTEIDKRLEGWKMRRSKSRIEFDGSDFSSRCGKKAGRDLDIHRPIS